MTFGQAKRGRCLVIGAGVSGLTTALSLERRGFATTIVSEGFAPRVTSVVAGALWEWPPSVCGRHHDETALASAKSWCMTSYRAFERLAREPESGVHLRRANFYFRQKLSGLPLELEKMEELRANVRGFVHGARQALPEGIRDTYSFLAPMIDTDLYLASLRRDLERAGCAFVERRIAGSIAAQEAALCRDYGCEVIVNCAGLGAREAANDGDLDPHRGALIRVRNDGVAMPRITEAHCVAHDASQAEQDMIFIVPRGENLLVLGGLVEPGEWSLSIDLESHPPIREMFERCKAFMPALRHARLDELEPVRAGLRPFRRGNVRLEREPGTRVVHNYGHGGAGVTLSWGCAEASADLIEQALLVRAA